MEYEVLPEGVALVESRRRTSRRTDRRTDRTRSAGRAMREPTRLTTDPHSTCGERPAGRALADGLLQEITAPEEPPTQWTARAVRKGRSASCRGW
ncbi:hypothetical protein ACR6C2_36210 [Streptomyces sp. INA 01156]